MTPLETRLRSLRQPASPAPSPSELRHRSAVRGRRRLFTAAAVAVPFIAVALAVFVAADPGDPGRYGRVGSAGKADAGADRSGPDGKLFGAARLASTAAYELQVETELAVRFTASKNDEDRTSWEAQAAASDKAIHEMNRELATVDTGKLSSGTRAALSLIERTPESPRRARAIVSGGVTEWPAVVEVYRNISKAFVDASFRLANNTSNPQLNGKARGWSIAVQIEADIATQRTWLTGVFTDGTFDKSGTGTGGDAVVQAFEQSVANEESHTRSLDDFGDTITRDVLRNALSGNDVSLADDLRGQALDNRYSASLGISLDDWRTYSGKKLDRVRTAEVKLADSVTGSVTKEAGEPAAGRAERGNGPLIAGAVLAGLLAVVLAYFVGRRAFQTRK
jgi:hypothetical protein